MTEDTLGMSLATQRRGGGRISMLKNQGGAVEAGVQKLASLKVWLWINAAR